MSIPKAIGARQSIKIAFSGASVVLKLHTDFSHTHWPFKQIRNLICPHMLACLLCFFFFYVANHLENQLLAEHMHPLATGAILQLWCLLTPQAWHSLWEGACPSLHQSPAALSAEQTLILLCIPSVHIFLMETVFIQEKETQILKSTKAIRICISHIKQEPQNFSSSGITSSYISAPSPFFARSAHRLISYLCAYLPAHWKKNVGF